MTSLYIHIPFCESKCFYCSFVVFVEPARSTKTVGQSHRVDDYLDCLSFEARRYKGVECANVFLGGGTPSYLGNDQLKRLFGIVEENFSLRPDAEYTIEANPESLDAVKLKTLRSHGINRISLGVQSFHPHYLKYLGRNHDQEKAREAYQLVRDAGFMNVNLDLMFGFPKETIPEIEQDVVALTALKSDHISLYMLNLEENSRFYAQKIQLPDDDLQAKQYEIVRAGLEDAGYRQYEISNFAKPGKESRHNLNYWQGGEYIGLGVGAHSYRGGKLFWNVSRLNVYIEKIREGGSAIDGSQQLDAHEQLKQAVLIGLRMNRGVRVESLEQALHCALSEEERGRIEHFIQHGFFTREDGYLKATERGRLVLDELCAHLS